MSRNFTLEALSCKFQRHLGILPDLIPFVLFPCYFSECVGHPLRVCVGSSPHPLAALTLLNVVLTPC